MTTAALALLEERAALGVAMHSRGPDLVLRPAAVLDGALLERVRALEPDLVAVLAERRGVERRASGAGPSWAVLPDRADPAVPPPGWLYLRRGRLRGWWVGPVGELAPGQGRTP